MRRTSLAILLGCILTLFLGCNGNTTPPQTNANAPVMANGKALPQAADTVARITVAEARAALDNGEAIMVDVRSPAEYKQEHITGSINLPMPETGSRAGELPKNKLLITYCSCPAEHSAVLASQMYKGNGLYNTAALVGGTDGWKSAGLQMNAGDKP